MSLFKLLLRMYFWWLVSLVSLKILDLYSVELQQPVNSFVYGPCKRYCQWKILEISWAKVIDNMFVPLLARCGLDLFKCCGYILLLWLIMLTFFAWHISLSWTLFSCLYFLIVMLEIKTPHDCVFTDIARLIMASTVSLFCFWDCRLFVPMYTVEPVFQASDCCSMAWSNIGFGIF